VSFSNDEELSEMAFWRSLMAASLHRKKVSLSTRQKGMQSTDLAFMEGLSLNLPLLLKTVHNILVSPADFMR